MQKRKSMMIQSQLEACMKKNRCVVLSDIKIIRCRFNLIILNTLKETKEKLGNKRKDEVNMKNNQTPSKESHTLKKR